MSERLHHGNETKSEKLDLSAETKNLQEKLDKAKQEAESHKLEVHELRHAVEQKAISGKEIAVGEKEQPKHSHHADHKALKADAYKRSLKRVQSELSTPQRVFSRIAHQPVVDSVSNAMSQTVARPSGILGGGVCAFLGSCLLVYFSRHYGFTYNYFFLFVLLAVGYLAGVVMELLVRSVSKLKR